MCQIILVKPHNDVAENELRNSCKSNPDGFGLAYTDNNKLCIYKTMRANTIINKYKRIRDQHPTSYILIHTRYATHGRVHIDNVHPFKVNKDVCVAHNGILTGFGSQSRSDTKDFITNVLKPISSEPNELQHLLFDPNKIWFRKLLSLAVGNYNKMVFLASSNEAVIINEDQGYYDTYGNWYSNESHLEQTKHAYEDYGYGYGYGIFQRCTCGSPLYGYERQIGYCDKCLHGR